VLTVDWLVADVLAVRQDSIGHIRYILKDVLKWVPLYGFYFCQVTLDLPLLGHSINSVSVL